MSKKEPAIYCSIRDDQPQTCTYNTVREKSIPNLKSIFFPLNGLGLCVAHISLTFLLTGVYFLSTPRILKLPTFKAGYKVSHRFKKSGAFSPYPEKPQKSRQRHQKRAHRRALNTGLQMALLMPGHVTKLKPSPAQVYTFFIQ